MMVDRVSVDEHSANMPLHAGIVISVTKTSFHISWYLLAVENASLGLLEA